MKLNLSKEQSDYVFHTQTAVRVSDLAGGIHVANHMLIAYATEAQMQLMAALGFPTLMIDAAMPINSHLEISYLSEAKYGDTLTVSLAIESFDKNQYQLIFNIHNEKNTRTICQVRMSMVFIDVKTHQRCDVPQAFIDAYAQLIK